MKIRFIFCLSAVILTLSTISSCKKAPDKVPSSTLKPEETTAAIKVNLPGCGNLYKVSETLYRGQQPTAEGFQELEKLGVKTVVNLRSFHSDRDELEGTTLAYEHIRMEAWDPQQEEIEAFLKITTDLDKQPVFVHCLHGADRTGTMVAVYRIVVEGWDTDKAIQEMQNGPFGFHEIFSGLPAFIEKLDVEKLRNQFNSEKEKPDS